MTMVIFTNNLKRHIDCPSVSVNASTVQQSLFQVFKKNTRLKDYVLDDQGRLRQHMLILVDGVAIKDRVTLSDAVQQDSEIYVLQALSGG